MNGVAGSPVPMLYPRSRAANASGHGPNKRAVWDLAVGAAGLIYLGVVLFLDLYSPVFGLVLIVLAGYEILEPRWCKRRSFRRRRQEPPCGGGGHTDPFREARCR